jgi:hypothetical protein
MRRRVFRASEPGRCAAVAGTEADWEDEKKTIAQKSAQVEEGECFNKVRERGRVVGGRGREEWRRQGPHGLLMGGQTCTTGVFGKGSKQGQAGRTGQGRQAGRQAKVVGAEGRRGGRRQDAMLKRGMDRQWSAREKGEETRGEELEESERIAQLGSSQEGLQKQADGMG